MMFLLYFIALGTERMVCMCGVDMDNIITYFDISKDKISVIRRIR